MWTTIVNAVLGFLIPPIKSLQTDVAALKVRIDKLEKAQVPESVVDLARKIGEGTEQARKDIESEIGDSVS